MSAERAQPVPQESQYPHTGGVDFQCPGASPRRVRYSDNIFASRLLQPPVGISCQTHTVFPYSDYPVQQYTESRPG